LFYDLVYVVIIAELAHALSAHVTWAGLGSFAFLFVIVWWAWLNGTTYHDLHGNNDIRTRAFTFLQMLSVVAMAVFAHDALGESSVGFALAYAGFQLILTYLWWRTGVYDANHRPLSQPYSATFLLNTLLFVASAFVAPPWRFYLWAVALLLSLLLPVFIIYLGRVNPQAQAEIDIAFGVSPSLAERFGLFTIIVLGEVIVGVVGGVSEHHHLTWPLGATAALGTLIAIGLWWVYFDFVSHHLPRQSTIMRSAWFYLHLPLTMGIAAVGAAVSNVVEHAGEHLPVEVRWLLVAAVAITLISAAVLTRTLQLSPEHQRTHRAGGRVMFVSAVLILLSGVFTLKIISLLVLLVALMLAPVFSALRVWIEMLGRGEATAP
jgi:low temperature requirement protein LtrA